MTTIECDQDRDDGSITSDCPDSADDLDVDGNEVPHRCSDDDGHVSDGATGRPNLPKFIYSSFNAKKMPLDKPVDV